MTETTKTLTLTTQAHVRLSFSSKDQTLTIDHFGERYLDSAAIALANVVDVNGLTVAHQSVASSGGTPGTAPNMLKTHNQAGAKLEDNGAPIEAMRHVVINPAMHVEVVDSLKGLFESSAQIPRGAGLRWSTVAAATRGIGEQGAGHVVSSRCVRAGHAAAGHSAGRAAQSIPP